MKEAFSAKQDSKWAVGFDSLVGVEEWIQDNFLGGCNLDSPKPFYRHIDHLQVVWANDGYDVLVIYHCAYLDMEA